MPLTLMPLTSVPPSASQAAVSTIYFLILLGFLMLGFFMVAYQVFGSSLERFSTLFLATRSLMMMSLGNFDYDSMAEVEEVWAPLVRRRVTPLGRQHHPTLPTSCTPHPTQSHPTPPHPALSSSPLSTCSSSSLS